MAAKQGQAHRLNSAPRKRLKIQVNGIVQGVGFRPFIYSLARRSKLGGFVSNTSGGVEIEVEGRPENLQAFLLDLEQKAPPLAVISSISSREVGLAGEKTFRINPSIDERRTNTMVSPDIQVCQDCLKELFDPGDRRYRYPFINCTHCGPRYTIIGRIPYDRHNTAMHSFEMCSECRREYVSPEDRRFHAQPVACPVCGPQVSLLTAKGEKLADKDQAIKSAIGLLERGFILAVKGLGGFHLSANAKDSAAVAELRKRKNRRSKPFAVMVRDIQAARDICVLSREEEQVLLQPSNPILLARKKGADILPETIAPDNTMFGVMLPGTPLHHLLLEGDFPALVMTSANRQGAPIYYDNRAALDGLKHIADFFLIHDRDIYCRCDDSVAQVLADTPRLIRRSRGHAPRPIMLQTGGPSVLGAGSDLKNTVCLLKDDKAVFSQHIGDLKDHDTYLFFRETVEHVKRIFQTKPEIAACDMHPGYFSSRWAKDHSGLPTIAVQHHHAHLAACLAENGEQGPAIGIILDGTGYGTDGTIWGGEVLVGDFSGFKRYAHLEYMPLPGGEAAIKAPWRIAVACLFKTFGEKIPALPSLAGLDSGPIIEVVKKNVNVLPTSSCGRLFDAVAILCGGKPEIDYEGQAAIEFMHAANAADGDILEARAFTYDTQEEKEGTLVIKTEGIIREVVKALKEGTPASLISRRFHKTLVDMFARSAADARRDSGINLVALSGGALQNRLLFTGLLQALGNRNFKVITHRETPCNDGGISLGQALIGRHILLSR